MVPHLADIVLKMANQSPVLVMEQYKGELRRAGNHNRAVGHGDTIGILFGATGPEDVALAEKLLGAELRLEDPYADRAMYMGVKRGGNIQPSS